MRQLGRCPALRGGCAGRCPRRGPLGGAARCHPGVVCQRGWGEDQPLGGLDASLAARWSVVSLAWAASIAPQGVAF
eukprot:3623511-Prymnesium_polylepis.1